MSEFKGLLDQLLATQPKESYSKLLNTVLVDQIQDKGIQDLVKGLYGSDLISHRITASILNAVFTERKATFLLSKVIVSDLLKGDVNISRNTVNSQSFKKLTEYFEETGLFRTVLSGGDARLASVVELSNNTLCVKFDTIVGQDFRKAQKDRVINVFTEKSQEKSQEKSCAIASDIDIASASEFGETSSSERAQLSSAAKDGKIGNQRAVNQRATNQPGEQDSHPEEADTMIDPDGPVRKPSIKELVFLWKAPYGSGLACVASETRGESVPKLAKIIMDHGYWNTEAATVIDMLFSSSVKGNMLTWKEDVTRALDEALIVEGKKSKSNFFNKLPF